MDRKTASERIIVALDVGTLHVAGSLMRELAPLGIKYFKVGLQLLTYMGAPQAVQYVHSFGCKVLFDGKFCDIPNTMGEAASAAASLGVAMFTIHAGAGQKSIKAAVSNCGTAKVLGVTVLTSIDEKECVSIFGNTPNKKVLQFAHVLKNEGAHGIICSPQELTLLKERKELDTLLKVAPGVRPPWAAANDQTRVMTPGEAIIAGADMLVIGRPITNPQKEIGTPEDATRLIIKEIEYST